MNDKQLKSKKPKKQSKKSHRSAERVQLEPLKKGQVPKLFRNTTAQCKILPNYDQEKPKTNRFLRELHQRMTWFMLSKFVQIAGHELEERTKKDSKKKIITLNTQTINEFLGGLAIPLVSKRSGEDEILGFKKILDFQRLKDRTKKMMKLRNSGDFEDQNALLFLSLMGKYRP